MMGKEIEPKILLGKILQRFFDKRISHVEGYTSFGYIKETNNSVYVTRQNGKDTLVSFNKILICIEAYIINPDLYDEGPGKLKIYITHVNSPVWSLLHMLNKESYQQ